MTFKLAEELTEGDRIYIENAGRKVEVEVVRTASISREAVRIHYAKGHNVRAWTVRRNKEFTVIKEGE